VGDCCLKNCWSLALSDFKCMVWVTLLNLLCCVNIGDDNWYNITLLPRLAASINTIQSNCAYTIDGGLYLAGWPPRNTDVVVSSYARIKLLCFVCTRFVQVAAADRFICAVSEAGALCAWNFRSSELVFCSTDHWSRPGSIVRCLAVDRRACEFLISRDNALRKLSFSLRPTWLRPRFVYCI